jgi:hypothetical protein
MTSLKQLLTEQTEATIFCKKTILAKPQFAANKWKAIGIWSKRNIAGSSTPSQHSYGNAIDWHGANGPGDPVMQQLADHLVANSFTYRVQNVIYNKQIWNAAGGWHAYNGKNPHTDHVHVDFVVKKSISSKTKKLHNDAMQQAVNDMYYVITTNPDAYFKSYRSWNPLSKGIGDDEEGAAKRLEEIYIQLVRYPWIKKYYTTCTDIERENMTAVYNMYKYIYDAILDGDSVTYVLKYFKWNPSSSSYEVKSKTFEWDYI